MNAGMKTDVSKIAAEESNARIAFIDENHQRNCTVQSRTASYRPMELESNMAMLSKTQKANAVTFLDRAVSPDDNHVWQKQPAVVKLGLMLRALIGTGRALLKYILGMALRAEQPALTTTASP